MMRLNQHKTNFGPAPTDAAVIALTAPWPRLVVVLLGVLVIIPQIYSGEALG